MRIGKTNKRIATLSFPITIKKEAYLIGRFFGVCGEDGQ